MDVLVFGSRKWDNPDTVHTALFMMEKRWEGIRLWEGCATGADKAGCEWGLLWLREENRHHFPVDWAKARATRKDWRLAGNERNQEMLGHMLQRSPERTFLAFHESLDPAKGGTSDMVTRVLLSDPWHRVWLVSGGCPVKNGQWLDKSWLKLVPPRRLELIKASMEKRSAS